MSDPVRPNENPMQHLEDWDADVAQRYPEPDAPSSWSKARKTDEFRDYSEGNRDGVREFYRLNHERQTVDFVRSMREKYLPP